MKTTVKTIIENTTTSEKLTEVINSYNNNVLDNIKNTLDFSNLVTIVDNINNTSKEVHTISFLNALEKDRKNAFKMLLENPCYNKIVISENKDKTVKTDTVNVVNSVVDIEKYFRLIKSENVGKNGRKIPNATVTIFGVNRFYGLLEKFIQNLLINQISGENEYTTDLTRIKLDDITFTENDGKCFDTTSTTALDKQLRVLTKFFGENDIKTRKKDIVLLRTQVVKMKFKTDLLHLDFSESKTSAFLKVLYKYFISVYNKHDTTLTSSNGKDIINFSENKTK